MNRKKGFMKNLWNKKGKSATKMAAVAAPAPPPNYAKLAKQITTPETSSNQRSQSTKSSRSSRKQDSEPESRLRSALDLNIENQEYFHGKLPRDEIDILLKANGDFIVRESQKGNDVQIVLSVFWECPRHFIVRTDNEGQFKFEGPSFPTVTQLIFHYVETKDKVSKLSAAKLIRPIPKEKWELDNNDITLGKMLGKGNFGEVYKGVYKNPNTGEKKEVAVKTCNDTMPESEKKLFLREARIMRRYVHENIVQLIGVCATKEPMMIVMELVSGGGLDDYLKKHANDPVTKSFIKEKVKFCKEAASGMEYLSNQECLHRDLAARNCLLGDKNTVKIADFGMSREGSFYEISAKKQMPIKWTAFEVLQSKKFTTKSDVWAYGILMWEIFENGKIPYPEMDNKSAIAFIKKGDRMAPPVTMPESLGKLMLSCWLINPEDRPDFTFIRKQCVAVYNNC